MAKQRLGSNKSETKAKRSKSKGKKRTMAMEKQSARHKLKATILASAMPSRGKFEAALAAEASAHVGRAVVLAHGAGGSSAHASMKAWRRRLLPFCDDVLLFNFPRPYRMPRLVGAFHDAIDRARREGHTRVVLAGVGLGARVALHLAAELPADDGEPVPPLAAALRQMLVGVVALSYPMLRAGSDERRDGPIRGLKASAPPVLFVSGSEDASMDAAALESARRACEATTEAVVVHGTDQSLSARSGTHLEADVIGTTDRAIGGFMERVLGSAEQYSKKRKVKVAPKKKVTIREGRETSPTSPGEAREEDKPPPQLDLSKVAEIEVSGCGCDELNGTYRADAVRDGVPSYRQVHGKFTIERDSAPGQLTQWCICIEYGFASCYFIDCEDDLPPSDGWSIGEGYPGPPPVLSGPGGLKSATEVAVSGSQHKEVRHQVAPQKKPTRAGHAPGSMSTRRKKRLQDNKLGIKKRKHFKVK